MSAIRCVVFVARLCVRRAARVLRPWAPLAKLCALLVVSIWVPMAAVRPVRAEYIGWGMPPVLAGMGAVLGCVGWLCIGLYGTYRYLRRLHERRWSR